jgi:hypothetical protein
LSSARSTRHSATSRGYFPPSWRYSFRTLGSVPSARRASQACRVAGRTVPSRPIRSYPLRSTLPRVRDRAFAFH